MRGVASLQRRCAAGFLGVALALLIQAPALSQPGGAAGLSLDEAGAVIRRMDGEARLQAVFGACPADTFRREAAGGRPAGGGQASLALCARQPAGCYEACLSGSGDHCFNLARAFQTHETVIAPRHAQMMFAMACAAGSGAGCTNRAASIRNSLHEGDPFRSAPEAEREACQFRSFRIACGQDDAWGCAMLGQSYRLGEGTARSAALARGAYRKSCRLNARFAACDFARDGLRDLAR